MQGKMFSAKKVFFEIITIFLFMQVYSVDFSFQLTPSYGFSCSDISELVYEYDMKESQISWKNYKPVLGIDTTCLIQNFIIDFKIHNSIPVALGNVTDKDFFTDETNDISMYSEHNLITDKDYLFKVDFSYEFNFSLFAMGLGLSGIYSNTKMEAVDGFFQYPLDGTAWKGYESKTELNGTVMSYEQSRYLLGLKLSLQAEIKRLIFNIICYYYPFGKVDCVDNHFLRSIQFCDSMKDIFSCNAGFKLAWKINRTYRVFAEAEYTYLRAKGNTSVNSLGVINHGTKTLDETCTVGTNYYDLVFSVGLMINIGN